MEFLREEQKEKAERDTTNPYYRERRKRKEVQQLDNSQPAGLYVDESHSDCVAGESCRSKILESFQVRL